MRKLVLLLVILACALPARAQVTQRFDKVVVTSTASDALKVSGFNVTVTGTATLTGTNTGDQTTITGNAGSATKLATARAINGVDFDGTAPITVTATATSVLTFGTHLSGTSYNGSTPVTIGTDATNANTASTIVARDANGHFASGFITVSEPNIGVTDTPGLLLDNPTAATALVPVQWSPRLSRRGSAWNTTTLVSESHYASLDMHPVSGATTYSRWTLSHAGPDQVYADAFIFDARPADNSHGTWTLQRQSTDSNGAAWLSGNATAGNTGFSWTAVGPAFLQNGSSLLGVTGGGNVFLNPNVSLESSSASMASNGTWTADVGFTRSAAATWKITDGSTGTGTLISNLTTAVENGVKLPSQGTAFSVHTASNVFNTTRDDVLYWAYNLALGSTTTRVNLAEPQLKWAIEADYNNGSAHLMELNLDYLSSDGMSTKRPFSWSSNRSTQVSALSLSAGKISFLNEGNVQEFFQITTASNINKVQIWAGTSQSGNITEWTNSTGNAVLAAVQSDGGASFPKLSAANGTLTVPDTDLLFDKTTGALNEKYWSFETTATQFLGRMRTDTLASANNWIAVTRTGNAVSTINFPGGGDFSVSGGGNFVLGTTASIGVGGVSTQVIGNSPAIILKNTAGAANNTVWTAFETNGTQLFGRVLNDALGSAQNWITVTRSGATVSTVAFPNGTVSANSASFVGASEPLRAGPGTVIGPPTGTPSPVDAAVAGNVTGTVQYCYTESDGVGVSTCSPAGSVTVTNHQVTVTVPLGRRGTSERDLYRTASGGSTFKLLHAFTGTEFFQTVYTDNTLDASLGATAPSSDTTALYDFELNHSVKYFRTHPDVGTGVGDITILTSPGGGVGGGIYAIDAYGPIAMRVVGAANGMQTQYTQASDGTYAGAQFLAQYLTNVAGASASTVWKINPKGNMALTPLTLSDAGAGDGATVGLSLTATFPAVSTATNNAAVLTATGAGNSAFDQRAFAATMSAGYTGTKNTFGFYGANATAAGNSFGTYGTATGAAAFSIGAAGVTSAGTKQIGIFGSSNGVDPSTLTFGSGVTGIAGAFSNGTATDDILTGFDSTEAVFRIKNGGDGAFASPAGDASLQWNWISTSGGGNLELLMNSGNDAQLFTTNNIPLKLGANNSLRWSISNVDGSLLAVSDNGYDIGASAATRPRTGYFGTSIVVPTATITGSVLNANGTAGAPAYSFTSATDTGMYWDTASLSFSVGNSRKFIVGSSGAGLATGNFDGAGWWTLASGAAGGFGLGSGHVLNWQSTTTNGGVTGDTGLARGGAGVLKVTTGAASYGTLDALGLKASGTPGASCTISAVAVISLTVVNGIVTACSTP